MITALLLDRLIVDPTLQFRKELDLARAEIYASKLREGAIFPAVRAFEDDTGIYLGDGFTRERAHRLAERIDILADIQPGGRRAAWLCALGANEEHGNPRTRDEGQAACRAALLDPELRGKSDRQVADIVHLSPPTVGSIRRKMIDAGEIPEVTEVEGKDGKKQRAKKGKTGTPHLTAAERLDALQNDVRIKLRELAAAGEDGFELDGVTVSISTWLEHAHTVDEPELQRFDRVLAAAVKAVAGKLRDQVWNGLEALQQLGVEEFPHNGAADDVGLWLVELLEEPVESLKAVLPSLSAAMDAAFGTIRDRLTEAVSLGARRLPGCDLVGDMAEDWLPCLERSTTAQMVAIQRGLDRFFAERQSKDKALGDRKGRCIARLRQLMAAGDQEFRGKYIPQIIGVIPEFEEEGVADLEAGLFPATPAQVAAPKPAFEGDARHTIGVKSSTGEPDAEAPEVRRGLSARAQALVLAVAEPDSITVHGYPLLTLAAHLRTGGVPSWDLEDLALAISALEAKAASDLTEARDTRIVWTLVDTVAAMIDVSEGGAPAASDEDAMTGEALDNARADIAELVAKVPVVMAYKELQRLQLEAPATITEDDFPKGRLRLPWWAPAELIAEAIRRVQKCSKANVGDPDELAQAIRAQLDRVHAVACLMGQTLPQLLPHGTLAVGGHDWLHSATSTRIEVTTSPSFQNEPAETSILVDRGALRDGMVGVMAMRLAREVGTSPPPGPTNAQQANLLDVCSGRGKGKLLCDASSIFPPVMAPSALP